MPEKRRKFDREFLEDVQGRLVAVQVVDLTLVPDTPKSPITPVSVTQYWFGYICPVPRLFEFGLGMTLARMVLTGVAPRVPLWFAAASVPAGYAAALVVPFVWSFVVATIVPVSLVILAYAKADVVGRPTGLRGPLAQRLGEILFGFYICQGFVVLLPNPATGRALRHPGGGTGHTGVVHGDAGRRVGVVHTGRTPDHAPLRSPPRHADGCRTAGSDRGGPA